MFLVKWQDLSEKVVYRKFTEIYELHVSALRAHACACACACVRREGGRRTQSQLCPSRGGGVAQVLARKGGTQSTPRPQRGALFLNLEHFP